MSTYKFCEGKCPQCPPGSGAYAMEYGGCLLVTSAWMPFYLIQLCVGHAYHVLESISDITKLAEPTRGTSANV